MIGVFPVKKNINLSDSEWKIMSLLWEDAPRTIMKMVAALKDETNWTKSTVITLLNRMEAKGAVYYKEDGKAREYYPAVKREEIAVKETESFLDRVFKGSLGLMMNTMVKQKALSREEIDELYKILKIAEGKEK
jgi:BlaI family penicillinase repressor